MRRFFVFDVESIGLHGDGFAVAGGAYLADGTMRSEFCFSCPRDLCAGATSDREWVNQNVPAIEDSHNSPREMRDAFWRLWLAAKADGAQMAAECLWPVEARFVEACVADDAAARNWEGPYPFMEISSVMQAAGMDPLDSYHREPNELPAHHPLADARQSARLLSQALRLIAHPAPFIG